MKIKIKKRFLVSGFVAVAVLLPAAIFATTKAGEIKEAKALAPDNNSFFRYFYDECVKPSANGFNNNAGGIWYINGENLNFPQWGEGNITNEQISKLKDLRCLGNPRSVKGINLLTGLEKIEMNSRLIRTSGSEYVTMDLSTLTNLTEVNLADNYIDSIKLPGTTTTKYNNFDYIDLSNNTLTTIDLSTLGNLRSLGLQNNDLKNLDISSLGNTIEALKAYGNSSLQYLDITDNKNLINLQLNPNVIVQTDVTGIIDNGEWKYDFSSWKFLEAPVDIDTNKTPGIEKSGETIIVKDPSAVAFTPSGKILVQIKQTDPNNSTNISGQSFVNNNYVLELIPPVKATTTYKAGFDTDGGTPAVADVTCTVTAGQSCTITIPNTTPTKDGNSFEGWTLPGSSTVYKPGDTVQISGDTTLKAVWKANGGDPNGGNTGNGDNSGDGTNGGKYSGVGTPNTGGNTGGAGSNPLASLIATPSIILGLILTRRFFIRKKSHRKFD